MKNRFSASILEKSKKTINKTFSRRYGLKLRPPQLQLQVLNLRLRSQNFGLWSNTVKLKKIIETKKLTGKVGKVYISQNYKVSDSSPRPLFFSLFLFHRKSECLFAVHSTITIEHYYRTFHMQRVLALCEFQCEFHYCDFLKHKYSGLYRVSYRKVASTNACY